MTDEAMEENRRMDTPAIRSRPVLRIGIGGPVGSGKTALMDALCKRLRDRYEIAAVTNVSRSIQSPNSSQFIWPPGGPPTVSALEW